MLATMKARTSYVVDCYFADPQGVDGVRMESHPIKAWSDAQAITEAVVMRWRKPNYYKVRAATRKGDRIIHDSRDAP
jgi:hypothetical protein